MTDKELEEIGDKIVNVLKTIYDPEMLSNNLAIHPLPITPAPITPATLILFIPSPSAFRVSY